MSEDDWTDRLQREDARRRGFDHEIKQVKSIVGEGHLCDIALCKNYAVKDYEAGEVSMKGGLSIKVCPAHDDEEMIWEEYQEQTEG